MSILSERRRFAPYGLAGGADGAKGVNLLRRLERGADGSGPGGRYGCEQIGAKKTVRVQGGDLLEVHTPGGGGYGEAGPAPEEEAARASALAPVRAGGSLLAYEEKAHSA